MTPKPTALVLCGGGGTRLGGIDKPLRDFCGQPLIARVLQGIVLQVANNDVILSVNRNLDRYAAFGTTRVDDGDFRDCGPLAGLLAGLEAATTEEVLCVPGDAPLLPPDLLQRLLHARLRLPGAAIAYAHDGRGPQPLCCLLTRSLKSDLRSYLTSGGRTPREWFSRHATAIADFSDSPAWAWSINTEEEWIAAEQRFKECGIHDPA